LTNGFVIRRTVDEKFTFYAGTENRHPKFGPVAAIFKTEAEAETRARGLRRQEPGVQFEVIAR
jgi:hypothetical protein